MRLLDREVERSEEDHAFHALHDVCILLAEPGITHHSHDDCSSERVPHDGEVFGPAPLFEMVVKRLEHAAGQRGSAVTIGADLARIGKVALARTGQVHQHKAVIDGKIARDKAPYPAVR